MISSQDQGDETLSLETSGKSRHNRERLIPVLHEQNISDLQNSLQSFRCDPVDAFLFALFPVLFSPKGQK